MTNQDVKQKQAFISGEGDCWYERNSHLDMKDRISNDLILKEIDRLNLGSQKCLEIGCAEGWRLSEINRRYGWDCFGIEPSKKAVIEGSNTYPNIDLQLGTADKLPYDDSSMSLIIVGFCLYLCDRSELFEIAKELDRVLLNNGVLIILDFYSEQPYKNEYMHLKGLSSFKMNYCKMFTWNPSYQVLSYMITDHDFKPIVKDKDERISICSLRKSVDDAYSEKPKFNI